jgi:hypothetical protein
VYVAGSTIGVIFLEWAAEVRRSAEIKGRMQRHEYG